MRKKIVLALSMMLMVLFVGGALGHAQMKIGIVDLGVVIDESEAGKAGNAQLMQFVAERQADLDGLEAQISTLQLELNGGGIPEATRTAKEAQIDQLLNDYMNRVNRYEGEIQELANVLRQNILREIAAVLQYYGDTNGYDIILDASAVLYFRRVVDLTWDIIRTYDELRRQGAIQYVEPEEDAQ